MAQLPPIPVSGDDRRDPGASRASNPVVGGYSVRRSVYAPPGDPMDWGYTGGHAFASYAPALRSSVSGRFRPYRDRDQTRILNGVASQGSIMDLQLSLIRAGLLDEDDVAFGVIDGATEDAFEEILSVANQNGLLWEDVLSQAAAGGMDLSALGGEGGAGLAPTVITLPNRDDLIAAASDFTVERYGERIDDDLQANIADAILDSLRTHQERQLQAELAAGEGSVVFAESAPDPARLLEEQVEERAPGLVMEAGVRDLWDEWMAAVQGPI